MALAALVFAEPDFILLDEPTNNLDRAGRASVIELLAGWRAGAIVVSHDRELLETMDAIVESLRSAPRRYGGNWSHYRERKAPSSLRRSTISPMPRSGSTTSPAHAGERRAQGAQGRRGAAQARARRHPAHPAQHDEGPQRASGGEAARLAERRRAQALDDAAAARERIEVLQPLSVVLPPTGLPAGKTVLRIDAASVGLRPADPSCAISRSPLSGRKRMAVTGANGSGKTTLLSLLTGRLAPWSGTVQVMVPFALLDQKVDLLDPAPVDSRHFGALRQERTNGCRAALARFMFRADAALQTVASLSGGQMLRAGLACVLGARAAVAADARRATNHLDIESIEAVEAGLRAYDGALLVVSHDEAFLDAW